MLILTRKPGESLYIGDVKVTVVELKGHQIRIGIDAPPQIRIYREEIYKQILEENQKAALTAKVTDTGLPGITPGFAGSDDEGDGEKRKPQITSFTAGRAGVAAGHRPRAGPSVMVKRKRRDKQDE